MRGVANGSNDNIFSAKYFCHFTYLLVFKEKQKHNTQISLKPITDPQTLNMVKISQTKL